MSRRAAEPDSSLQMEDAEWINLQAEHISVKNLRSVIFLILLAQANTHLWLTASPLFSTVWLGRTAAVIEFFSSSGSAQSRAAADSNLPLRV